MLICKYTEVKCNNLDTLVWGITGTEDGPSTAHSNLSWVMYQAGHVSSLHRWAVLANGGGGWCSICQWIPPPRNGWGYKPARSTWPAANWHSHERAIVAPKGWSMGQSFMWRRFPSGPWSSWEERKCDRRKPRRPETLRKPFSENMCVSLKLHIFNWMNWKIFFQTILLQKNIDTTWHHDHVLVAVQYAPPSLREKARHSVNWHSVAARWCQKISMRVGIKCHDMAQ